MNSPKSASWCEELLDQPVSGPISNHRLYTTTSLISLAENHPRTHQTSLRHHSYLRKLRSLLDRIGSRKHVKNCYRAISPTGSLNDDFRLPVEHDDHHIKCNCHEFYMELELALSQSRNFARRPRNDFVESHYNRHTRVYSETPTISNINTDLDLSPQLIITPQIGVSTRRPQSGKHAVNRWQRDSNNSSASFDFEEGTSNSYSSTNGNNSCITNNDLSTNGASWMSDKTYHHNMQLLINVPRETTGWAMMQPGDVSYSTSPTKVIAESSFIWSRTSLALWLRISIVSILMYAL